MKNILIVEDNPIQRKNLRIMLQVVDEQFHIYEAESKDEALQIVKTASIQLFFIDILLKNSLGLDLAIEIRKMRGYEFTFIVFLTTHVEYLSEAFKKVHCYDYIIKPYDKDEIINIVMRHRNLQQMSLKKTICFTAVKQKIEKTQLVLYLLCLLL